MTPPRWLSRAAVACLTLLVLLLPALLAGLGLATPPAPAELERLATAWQDRAARQPGSEVVHQFYRSAVSGVAFPDTAAAREAFVVRARLSQVVAVFGLTLAVYLAVLLARGRLLALLAAASLGVLPPITSAGHVLRPEGPAALFAAFGLLLLCCMAGDAMARLPGRRLRRAFYLGGLSLCASVANGLSVSALPTAGECLLVPGLILVLGAVQLGLRAFRCLSRRGAAGVPIRALNSRLLPWTATALLMPAVALLVLWNAVEGPVERLQATASMVPLCPQGLPGAFVIGCIGLGLAAAVLRTGVRFGRGARITAELVTLVFAAVFLAAFAGDRGEDGLPAAAAVAILMAEGVFVAFGLCPSVLLRRHRGATSPPA